MEDNNNITLDSEELHYLCQETNRPTLGVTWNYLELVYFNSFIREQPKKYESFWCYLSEYTKPELCKYASYVELKETVKNQRLFDIARWEHTRHLMTEEDIHINGKRVAMTERMMEEVLINELDNIPSIIIYLSSIYHLSIIYISSMYFLTTIIYLSSTVYRLSSNYHLKSSTDYLKSSTYHLCIFYYYHLSSTIYHITIIYLSSLYHLPIIYVFSNYYHLSSTI